LIELLQQRNGQVLKVEVEMEVEVVGGKKYVFEIHESYCYI
jgi:hypothetical protein